MAVTNDGKEAQMHSLEIRQTIGERLRAARRQAGMSQKGVATDLGRVQQTIAAWEAGKQMPDIFDLRNLCTLYAITPNHILLDEGGMLPRISVAGSYAACVAEGRPLCQIINGDRHMLRLKVSSL